jgi:mRNA-degrading endonuclease RelE of RelBE toxin-antitoxin system
MPSLPTWNDWLTQSTYRVRISLSAAEKLRELPGEMQVKLRSMLEEIAELAALSPMGTARAWATSFNRPLLQLRLGRVSVHYAIDEDTRTLSVEHVVVPGNEQDISKAS